MSSAERFVSIAAVRGVVTISGTADRPVRIRSWDPLTDGPDQTYLDGRAFVLLQGGRMDLRYTHFAHLGFGTGATSGVAWRGSETAKVGGRYDRFPF